MRSNHVPNQGYAKNRKPSAGKRSHRIIDDTTERNAKRLVKGKLSTTQKLRMQQAAKKAARYTDQRSMATKIRNYAQDTVSTVHDVARAAPRPKKTKGKGKARDR